MRKVRHGITYLGTAAADTPSTPIDCSNFNRGIWYPKVASATFIFVEASPDGGATWFQLFSQDGTEHRLSTTGGSSSCYGMEQVAGLMRMTAEVNPITDLWFEGIRDIN